MPAQASARVGLPREGRPRRFSLANWSVSTRLVALCAIASVLGLVFGGLRISDALDTSDAYSRTVQLADVGSKITALAQAMEDERDLTVGQMALRILASDATLSKAGPPVMAAINADADQVDAKLASAQHVTDAAAASATAAVRGIGSAFPPSIQRKAANVRTQIDYIPSVAGLRRDVRYDSPVEVIDSYSGVLAIMFALDNEITTGTGDAVLGDDARALSALSQAEDQVSQQRAIIYGALLDSSLNDAGPTTAKGFNNIGGPTALANFGGLDAFIAAQDLQSDDQQAFQDVATTAQTQAFLNPPAKTRAAAAQLVQDDNSSELIENLVNTAGDPTVIFPLGKGLTGQQSLGFTFAYQAPDAWYADISATLIGTRSVDNQLASSIVARSQFLQHQAYNAAILTAIAVAVAVLLVLLAAALVARSMVNPLRRLQRDALEIAAVKLPERVAAAASMAELAEADPDAFNRVEPIAVQTTDEIGRVARAFDQVHAEAVRLAGTEAQLRSNLNAMFISLSRRSVPLIDRLSRMIDSLEQNEDDPDQLGALFSMDHLVTRMRRNSENLLVLAGEEPVRKWSEPVPLTDVARAAAAEIEQYGRVTLTVQPGIMVSGQAAADVVHLLAELLENATLFSPRNTQVQVAAADAPGGGMLIEIRDEGVGVSSGRLSEINWRLDHPPGVDVSVSRHMGLFAVSRLAARRGIRVRLRAGAQPGLTAMVWLPGTLVSHEQPPTVGLHSRPQGENVALAEEMAFAESLPGESDLLQRTSGGHGGRHRLGLLATAGVEETAVGGRGYAAIDSGRPGGSDSGRSGGSGYPDDGRVPADRGYRSGEKANGSGNSGDGGYADATGYPDATAYPDDTAYSGGRGYPGNGRGALTGEQRSVWFAAKTPSAADPSAAGAAANGADVPPPTAAGTGWQQADWGQARRLTAGAHYTGAFSAELAARATVGDDDVQAPLPQTRAGLPMRVPQASTGFTGQPPAYRGLPDDAPVLGAPPGPGEAGPPPSYAQTGGQRQVTQPTPRRRSPEAARSRLAGFQLGNRDAAQEAGRPQTGNAIQTDNGMPAGSGTQTDTGTNSGNGGWAAFSRRESPHPRGAASAHGGIPHPPSAPR